MCHRRAPYERAEQRLVQAFSDQRVEGPLFGPVETVVRFYWDRRHVNGDMAMKAGVRGRPQGDIDAALKATHDALAKARVIHNDAQVARTLLENHYDKDNPRIEVEVKPWEA